MNPAFHPSRPRDTITFFIHPDIRLACRLGKRGPRPALTGGAETAAAARRAREGTLRARVEPGAVRGFEFNRRYAPPHGR